MARGIVYSWTVIAITPNASDSQKTAVFAKGTTKAMTQNAASTAAADM